ncbi:MAG: gamma-glutamyltransferase [Thermomicrobiales bacterium]
MVIATTEARFAQTMVTARGGMVTANQRLAAEAGAGILARGGNAVDAAIATAFAVGVVEPAMSGIGGRGYMVIHQPETGTSLVIDGHERAPRAARPDMFAIQSDAEVLTSGWGSQALVVDQANAVGHQAVAVPGVLAALGVAHRRFGRLPWRALLEPAIALAAEGFTVTVPLATTIARSRAKLARFPATAAIFLPNGCPPVPGERLAQPDLARSLGRIAAEGIAAFYTGALARAIVAEIERGGGILTLDDLAAFQPRIWDRPLTGSYRGYCLLTVPEATGGITILQIMNLLEGFDLAALDPDGPHALHLLLEAMRIAFADRLAVIEDPAFAPVPFAGLASKEFAALRRQTIAPDRARETVSPADPWPFDDVGREVMPRGETAPWDAHDTDTTHFCVVDGAHTVVAMTQSIIDAFGSGVVVPGAGFLLNSAMHNFNPIAGRRGEIAPWKRSAHNGAPTIVLREDGTPYLAAGGAGGTKVITGVVQMLVNRIDRGWTMQEAVAAPRVHNEGGLSEIDAQFPPITVNALRDLGHRLEVIRPTFASPGFSRVNAIAVDETGALTSGIDVFTDAGAAGLEM